MLKELLVSFVNENLFEFGKEDVSCLDVPVDSVSVKCLLCECLWTNIIEHAEVVDVLALILGISVLESLHKVLRNVHARFMSEAFPCALVELWAKEIKFSTDLLSSFACKFGFKARAEHFEVVTKSEVSHPESIVRVESCQENPSAIAPVEVLPLSVRELIQVTIVLVHLLLRVNVTEHACLLPPLWRCLHEHGIWVNLLNQFLSALSEHCRLVARSDQIDFLPVELLSHVQQSCLENRVSTFDKTKI